MSYRTYVNGQQLFGNNEIYPQWIDFLKTQGVEIDEDDCYRNGEIKNVMKAIETLEQIVWDIHKHRLKHPKQFPNSMFDITNIPETLKNQPKKEPDSKFNNSLLDKLINVTEHYYCFLPYTFYHICEDVLEPDNAFKHPGHFYNYRIKPGCKITVQAY